MIAEIAPFDRIAVNYRNLWDDSAAGASQREAVWRYLKALIRAGDRVLDLGCGNGEDALRLARLGACVTGIDASPEMVRIARERGADARVRRIEDVTGLKMKVDGIVSMFGALNCVADLPGLRDPLAAMTPPGAYMVLCVMGRFCLQETIWYFLHGDIRRAARRWKGHAGSSLGLRVWYPSVRKIAAAFSPSFRLEETASIGILVPPSFVRGVSGAVVRRFDRIDRRIAGWPICRALGDHRVLIFRRV